MNGRCDKDPFQLAVDVCDICYHDICRSCVVEIRGRKHPVCPQCAVDLSGVNPGAPRRAKGQRRTVKQRRAAYQERPADASEEFTYFDEVAPTENKADNERRSWLKRVVKGIEAHPDRSTGSAPIDPWVEPPATAADRLAALRTDATEADASIHSAEEKSAPPTEEKSTPAPWNEAFTQSKGQSESADAAAPHQTTLADRVRMAEAAKGEEADSKPQLAAGLERLLKGP